MIADPLYGVPKVRCPFEPAVAAVNVWSYRVTGNGKLIKVPQSSQWLPMSSTADTNLRPARVSVYEGTQPSGVVASGADCGNAMRRAAARDLPGGAALNVEARKTPIIEMTATANAM